MKTIDTTSALEHLLVRFWEAALGRKVEGRDTDFFAAGGRAPEARRLLTLVKRAFNVSPRVDTLRTAPTVRAFAEALKHQVDHPGRLERLAERLLLDSRRAPVAAQKGQRAGASW
jgi:hypothetical protein